MNFLRNLLASILGCLVAFGLLVVMFFIFAALVGSANDGVVVKKNSVLELSLTDPIKDYVGRDETDPFAGLLSDEVGLDDILHAIEVARGDANIAGISIAKSFLQTGLAQTQEMRKALLDFKSEGKFIYAHFDYCNQKDYYLATVADKIYLNPVGAMDFKGLATEVLYFKDLQEKTGIKLEVIRHGKYKAAVEPFLSNNMSEENRNQIKELITSIWDTMIADISDARNITPENLNTIADTLGARSPEYAVASGLIDDNLYFDQYEALIREKIGVDEYDDINYVDFGDYIQVANKKGLRKGEDKIAVVYAQGEIMYGEGSKDVIGQGLLTTALKKAVDDESIKAIVLRVDSPGEAPWCQILFGARYNWQKKQNL